MHNLLLTALLALATGWAAVEQDPHAQHRKAMAAADKDAQEAGRMSIPDLELLNQEGEAIRFYSDLVKGRTVVINSIFTTCTTICPPMGANFAKLQKMLGDRVGKDVFLISLSVDPVVDTPPRLKAWAAKFGAAPGWTLVTGPKTDMDRLLKALKFFTPDKTDHSPTVLVGNEAQGHWRRAYGLAPPAKLAQAIDAVQAHGRTEQ